ncbi:MAG: PCRF domain-containing protein, partial [Akkermansiaceae bacterium]
MSFLLPMDYAPLIEKRTARLAEIEELMSDPEFFNDQKNSTAVMREHRSLKKLLDLWAEHQQILSDIEGNEELAKGDDPEFAAMAEEEL